MLARKLGIRHGDFFDINDTCNGFMKSIDIAGLYIGSGRYGNMLLVACESPYELKDILRLDITIDSPDALDSRLSGLIVGSGAAAMVLGANGDKGRISHYGEQRTSEDWDASILTLPGTAMPGAKYGDTITGFWSDGRLISSALIREMPMFVTNKLAEWGLDIGAIDLFIHHQLGNNVTFALMDKFKADHGKAPVNTFREYGNMATVNIPVNLAMADEQGLVEKGDSVLLLSSSCGLSYSITHIVW
jgi:3-oxoacyl-[acyl-carrier-protein] synthase-3